MRQRPPWGVLRWLALSTLFLTGACGKTPSILWAHVGVDDDVPMLSELRATVVSVSHPELEPSVQLESLVMSDAGVPPAPFAFPVIMPITLKADYVGDVLLTAEGLDRATQVVIATGSTETTVLASMEMHVHVTMSLVQPPGSDVSAGNTP